MGKIVISNAITNALKAVTDNGWMKVRSRLTASYWTVKEMPLLQRQGRYNPSYTYMSEDGHPSLKADENKMPFERKRLQNTGFLSFLWYNRITFETVGVMSMSIIAGILVCAFVYVIRESLTAPGEEDYEG
ncbi:hypothetical protein AB4Z29_02205 [Paenibacillus sp. 2TAB23]|uniref:hypothetical protein n=1 Tax=Paenibacillus sp. 2TAB23 TaxID=3233004 RepID=UPI003F944568